MRILLVDRTVKQQYLAQRLQAEGESVQLLVPETSTRSNLVPVTSDASSVHDWSELALFLSPGAGSFALHLTNQGIDVVGGGPFHDTLYRDPDYARTLAAKVRLPVLDLDNGGVTLNLCAFFSGKHFVQPAFSYEVTHGLFEGGNTEEGFMMHALPNNCPLVTHTFEKLSILLTGFRFIGPVFMTVQMDLETMVPLVKSISVEIPEGFWPAFLSGLNQPLSKFLEGLASGKRFTVKFTEEIAGAVKVSIPPYPTIDCPWLTGDEAIAARELLLRGLPSYRFPFEDRTNTFLMEVGIEDNAYRVLGPELAYIGSTGTLWDIDYVLKAHTQQFGFSVQVTSKDLSRGLSSSLSYFENYGMLEVGDEHFVQEVAKRVRSSRKVKQPA